RLNTVKHVVAAQPPSPFQGRDLRAVRSARKGDGVAEATRAPRASLPGAEDRGGARRARGAVDRQRLAAPAGPALVPARRRGGEGPPGRIPARGRGGRPFLRRAARARRGPPRRGRAHHPRLLRGTRDGARRGGRALAPGEERRRHRPRRAAGGGVPGRAHSGRHLDPPHRAQGAAHGAAEGPGHRRLLSRAVLRHGGGGGRAPAPERPPSPPDGAGGRRLARPGLARRAGRREVMIFKPYYYFETGCAGYLFGCGGLGKCAVVDAHEEDVDAYIAFAASKGLRITHVI